jgi:cytochrome c oxidase subunit 2
VSVALKTNELTGYSTMKKFVCVLFVLSMICLSGQALAAGDAAKGKTLYVVCSTCHGPDGKGMDALNAPNLTQLQDWYMIRQLKNFREGLRGVDAKDVYGMQMRPMALTLADDQAIEDVTAYIQTLGQ